MSMTVELAELQERVDEYGPVAFLVTVGDDGQPHVVSAAIALDGSVLVADAGRTTCANVEQGSTVTALWPGPDGGDYCLIIDGAASVSDGSAGRQVVVEPLRAVLHRVADAPGSGPRCITVLDQRAGRADNCAGT